MKSRHSSQKKTSTNLTNGQKHTENQKKSLIKQKLKNWHA